MTKTAEQDPVLVIRDLSVEFTGERGTVKALDGVGFSLNRGQVLGVIGESGSGKSVTMRAILRILPRKTARISGQIVVDGEDVLAMNDKQLATYRGRSASMIFQEPALSLDPVFTVGHQIAETVMRHAGASRDNAWSRALDMLEKVKIPSAETRLRSYPHEMSGGMRQRAMIALALSCDPKLLLADEPTTALDATVQIQIILLLRQLQLEMQMATVFVTHDVGVAAEIADQIAVMYGGRIVEYGAARDVLKSPQHPYTKGLLSSTVMGSMAGTRITAIPGMPPDLNHMPPGCAFAPRCPHAQTNCQLSVPELKSVDDSTKVACVLHDAAFAGQL